MEKYKQQHLLWIKGQCLINVGAEMRDLPYKMSPLTSIATLIASMQASAYIANQAIGAMMGKSA